jgi:methyl-accepting chemotaxis protein
MTKLFRMRRQQTIHARAEAIHRAHAVAEYLPDGTLVDANPAYLEMIGYSLAEILGKHHGMLVPSSVRDTEDYRIFWAQLAKGERSSGRFKRILKGGAEI